MPADELVAEANGIRVEREGTLLVLRLDIDAPGVPSKSGKSTVLASTRGAMIVGPGLRLNLNLYRVEGGV